MRIAGAIPPIIDNDTWERVQMRMKDNKRNAANGTKYKYLLSGLVECGQCGGAFTGRTNKNSKGYVTRSYVCDEKYRTRTCKAKNLNADELEEILSMSPNLALTREAIAAKLRADAQSLQEGDIERLLKAYVTKIYAHNDKIIITGGVHLSGCGGGT